MPLFCIILPVRVIEDVYIKLSYCDDCSRSSNLQVLSYNSSPNLFFLHTLQLCQLCWHTIISCSQLADHDGGGVAPDSERYNGEWWIGLWSGGLGSDVWVEDQEWGWEVEDGGGGG